MLLNLLLICALVGAVWALLEKLWDRTEPLLATIVSFFVPGLFTGLLLFGIMGFGYLVGWWGDIHIYGIHPFWVGVVPMFIREVFLAIRTKVRR